MRPNGALDLPAKQAHLYGRTPVTVEQLPLSLRVEQLLVSFGQAVPSAFLAPSQPSRPFSILSMSPFATSWTFSTTFEVFLFVRRFFCCLCPFVRAFFGRFGLFIRRLLGRFLSCWRLSWRFPFLLEAFLVDFAFLSEAFWSISLSCWRLFSKLLPFFDDFAFWRLF